MLFGGKTKIEGGMQWFEYGRLTSDKLRTPLSITFAEVATHNHFVLDRGGKVFNRTAPIIKLPTGATEEEHLGLLGYLNSSTADFWMKQVCMNKGAGKMAGSGRVTAEGWEGFVQRAGTALEEAPVPGLSNDVRRVCSSIARLAERREPLMPRESISRWVPGNGSLAESVRLHYGDATLALARMCALQEELDWLIYDAFGLLTAEDRMLLDRARGEVWPDFPNSIGEQAASIGGSGLHQLHPGHRAFEVVLARDCVVAGTTTAWFERNGYRLPSEIPALYSPACQRLIDARVAIIDRNLEIRLIEKPEFKRRWTFRDYGDEARSTVEGLLLDQAEAQLKASTQPKSLRRLVEEVLFDARSGAMGQCRFGDDAPAEIEKLCLGTSIPYLAPMRFTTAGMDKLAQWETTWDLQRREDAGENLEAPIPVPPKYVEKDFREDFYGLRGPLDVPNERFIAYPGCERDDASGPLIGWAGWDHLQRAQALASLYNERKNIDGWGAPRLAPMLAGLLELIPWLLQWHNEPDESFDGARQGESYKAFLDAELHALKLTVDDLRAWRLPERGRGRGGRKSTAKAAPQAASEPEGGTP
jgi:hypothetical protein